MKYLAAYFMFMGSLPVYVLSLHYGVHWLTGVSGVALGLGLLWLTER